MATPCRGLVLAGGGAKGSYQVGAYRALRELGWNPQIITGTSVGCLNAALFVLDKITEAEELWKNLDIHGVLETPTGKTPEELQNFLLDTVRSGGLDLEPLGDVIDKYLDEDAIRAAPVRYGLVMTEMNTLKSRQLPLEQIPYGKLKEYMMASSACFPALRPRTIDGVKYIDGGWRDNMPLDLAANMGATELVAVDIEGVGYNKPNRTGLPTRVIRSHWDLGPMFDFDGVRAARNIAIGYLDTLRAFGRVGGTAYALLPDPDGFLPKFAAAYQKEFSAAVSRAPTLALAENMARQRRGYPAPFSQNLLAPTKGASAPLELAAEKMNVPPEEPYTPRLLALTFLGSFDRDPADRFRVLLGMEEGNQIGETAMAAAAPDDFITALVSRTLQQMNFF